MEGSYTEAGEGRKLKSLAILDPASRHDGLKASLQHFNNGNECCINLSEYVNVEGFIEACNVDKFDAVIIDAKPADAVNIFDCLLHTHAHHLIIFIHGPHLNGKHRSNSVLPFGSISIDDIVSRWRTLKCSDVQNLIELSLVLKHFR